jgi:hypothetical protein
MAVTHKGTNMQFSIETTTEHVAGLQLSADAIGQIMADGIKDDRTLDLMDKNVRHIRIMCGMDHIRSCGADLKSFLDAAAAGAAWAAS